MPHWSRTSKSTLDETTLDETPLDETPLEPVHFREKSNTPRKMFD